MRIMLATLAALACLAGPALAGTIENSFGNTVVVTTADGAVARYHFEPDGTYHVTSAAGDSAGAWAVNGEQICLTPSGGAQQCVPYNAGYNVGDTWTAPGANNTTNTIALVAGR